MSSDKPIFANAYQLTDLGRPDLRLARPLTILLAHPSEPMDPWTKLGCLWQFCIPNLKVGWVEDLPTHETDPVKLAQGALYRLTCQSHFSFFTAKPEEGNEATQAQHVAIRLLDEAKYLAALRTLHHHFTTLQREPFRGFAVRRKADGELAVNGYGGCLYATEQQAQEVVDLWARDPYKYTVGSHEIVACRVTLENGLVWEQQVP
jgi:hypothetical protein